MSGCTVNSAFRKLPCSSGQKMTRPWPTLSLPVLPNGTRPEQQFGEFANTSSAGVPILPSPGTIGQAPGGDQRSSTGDKGLDLLKGFDVDAGEIREHQDSVVAVAQTQSSAVHLHTRIQVKVSTPSMANPLVMIVFTRSDS